MLVDINNTGDGELLDEDVDDLAAMGLTDLLTDGGYIHKVAEAHCRTQGITQYFTGIKGNAPPEETLSLAEFEWDGHELLACPAGHEPLDQRAIRCGPGVIWRDRPGFLRVHSDCPLLP